MSKKLEGNGLWESSRMMLPQHKEQSMLARQAEKTPPTSKETELMRRSIILPVALRIVEKNSRDMELSSQTLRPVYAAAAKVMIRQMREDLQKSKKALVESQIRLTEDSKDEAVICYRYVCRGIQGRLEMTKEFMRQEVSLTIGRYASSLVTTLQQAMSRK
ncbi:hypothetical protein WMW72_29120 [Paenibacillus filicis]|uniref:Uncharacterized protein n=1 Tax=Paenibacillus filicis TaxID=669464 RepID=A0ABU9DSX0_9BACL